jgi:hypothetical protein
LDFPVSAGDHDGVGSLFHSRGQTGAFDTATFVEHDVTEDIKTSISLIVESMRRIN